MTRRVERIFNEAGPAGRVEVVDGDTGVVRPYLLVSSRGGCDRFGPLRGGHLPGGDEVTAAHEHEGQEGPHERQHGGDDRDRRERPGEADPIGVI